jgi:hypothetical protein
MDLEFGSSLMKTTVLTGIAVALSCVLRLYAPVRPSRSAPRTDDTRCTLVCVPTRQRAETLLSLPAVVHRIAATALDTRASLWGLSLPRTANGSTACGDPQARLRAVWPTARTANGDTRATYRAVAVRAQRRCSVELPIAVLAVSRLACALDDVRMTPRLPTLAVGNGLTRSSAEDHPIGRSLRSNPKHLSAAPRTRNNKSSIGRHAVILAEV